MLFFLADPGPLLLPRFPLLFCVVLPETFPAVAADAGALLLLGGGVATAALETAGELLWMFLGFPRRLVLGITAGPNSRLLKAAQQTATSRRDHPQANSKR